MKFVLILIGLLGSVLSGCSAQVHPTPMKTAPTNPMLCDPETGHCELPVRTVGNSAAHPQSTRKPIKIIYFTDPICSSCWGIEPQLRKLELEYGPAVDVEYHMGGLLPDWSYNSGGISKPSDVASHWDEASHHYDMPIDGDVWLEDPLSSSYPPSIAFKAAQLQDESKAHRFLRVLREQVFLQKKNITKWDVLSTAATGVGLDAARMKADLEGEAKALFEADLALGQRLGVRGFPTMFVVNEAGTQEVVYGSKPYAAYEQAIRKQYPQVQKTAYDRSWKHLFRNYPSLTAREFSELSGMDRAAAEPYLNQLTAQGHLKRESTKNGFIWRRLGS